jgi:cytoskeletal protein RodZ
MNNETLGQLLVGLLEKKNGSIEQLADSTNIPRQYLEALLDDRNDDLPALPYVRGYLAKIAVALGEDPAVLQIAYREMELKRSGPKDILPANRFALDKNRSLWWKVLAAGVGIFLISLWLYNFLGIPKLDINLPETPTVSETDLFTIQGAAGPKETVYINNEQIYVTSDGFFSKEVLLDPGFNTFEIKAKKFLGRETKITRQIIYEQSEESQIPAE